MKKKTRVAAFLLAVAVLFVMLSSALFIAAEAGHECPGENCSVCCLINACREALKNLSLAVCVAVFAASLIYALRRRTFARAGHKAFHTPVTLKVRLSN